MPLGRRRLLQCLATIATCMASGAGCRLRASGEPATPDQHVPEFVLLDEDGHAVSLDALVAQGPAVLVFYRGHW